MKAEQKGKGRKVVRGEGKWGGGSCFVQPKPLLFSVYLVLPSSFSVFICSSDSPLPSRPVLLTIHTLITFLTTGVVLCVAFVHYPLFAKVGEQTWAAYHEAHVRAIGPLIAPLMFAELVTAILVLVPGASGKLPWQAIPATALLAIAWIATFAFAVPAHTKLATTFDAPTFQALLTANWIRTIAWSGRSVLLAWTLLAR